MPQPPETQGGPSVSISETRSSDATANGNAIDMLHGPIWNRALLFALPVAATGVLEQLFNAVGRGSSDAVSKAVHTELPDGGVRRSTRARHRLAAGVSAVAQIRGRGVADPGTPRNIAAAGPATTSADAAGAPLTARRDHPRRSCRSPCR